MTIPLFDLHRQYESIKDELATAVMGAVESTQYILGDEVVLFEDEFAQYCEVGHCVGVGSGTAAIHLALEALGIGIGDEVIAPANTFIASILPVLKLGARPVLVDCDERTAAVDPDEVAAAIGPDTKAVIAVDLYGQPADYKAIRAVCDEHGLLLLEDACQAHGARHDERRTGGFGAAAAFSFYPGKNLGAVGDAGAVTTDDAELAQRIRLLRHLGQERKYVHTALGWNERLDTVQAAVLRVKLRHLDRWNDLRRAHAATYSELLTDAPVCVPEVADGAEPVWHLYVIRAANRDEIQAELLANDVVPGMHYPLPLHLQPALQHLGYERGAFPVTEAWASELLSLPLFPELERAEIELIADVVSRTAAAAHV
jgi:dTDP-4-amino-4,6-dideoxygalactose transaminase